MIETLQTRASDGAATAARYAGAHGPPLVFVHGVGSTAAIWDAQLDACAPTHQALAVELRGNGIPKPEPDPQFVTRAGYARDVLAVADASGMERFTLVGCSLGGVVAFELWKTVPHRIDAMVIVGSFARYPQADVYAQSVVNAVRDAGDMRVFARMRAERLTLPPERMRETIEQMAIKTVPSYLAATQATWTGDYRDVLPTISVPVLVLCGEHDVVAPLILSQEIAAAIPHAHVEVIEDAGHVANADNPAAFNALLEAFLREHDLV